MNEPAPISITINGRPVQARTGQTVYEAAAATGIHIPALCYHPRLKPEGACRICLVEIDKQRSLQPSCTFPVVEGMVVRTDTPAVIASRKASLQMIFSERTHYCMFCPASGNSATSMASIAGRTRRITKNSGRSMLRGNFSGWTMAAAFCAGVVSAPVKTLPPTTRSASTSAVPGR